MAETQEIVTIGGPGLSAGIANDGAELQWLRDTQARDLLWDGDPAFWNGRAPILFPIVGAVADGVIRVDGRDYPLPRHGFARRRTFTLVDRSPAQARFRLEADAETRAIYPFDFRLDLVFTIDEATLDIAAELTSPSDAPLAASFGFHPAFRWPLPYGQPRDAHRLVFAADEPAPVRRLDGDGLVRPDALPSPIEGRTLKLEDRLFDDDALILDRPASRRVTYGAPGAPGLQIDFADMPMLGIWTKPGAGFLCIEPWAGIADPAGFTDDFHEKPGVVTVGPGGMHRFGMRITITDTIER